MSALSHHPGATALRRVAAGLALGTALAACLMTPAPAEPTCPAPAASASASAASTPVPPPGAAASAPAVAGATSSAARPPLRAMNDDFGRWECGRPWLVEGKPPPRRRPPRGECLIDTGCAPAWTSMQPPIEACPPKVPVVTMEQLVRNEPGGPGAEDPVVIRGRLVSFRNLMWPVLTSHNDCGHGRPLFAIEVPIEGTCYGLALSAPLFGCALDDTKSCCDHLPLGREVALVGTYSPTAPGIKTFKAWLEHARICTLPEAR